MLVGMRFTILMKEEDLLVLLTMLQWSKRILKIDVEKLDYNEHIARVFSIQTSHMPCLLK